MIKSQAPILDESGAWESGSLLTTLRTGAIVGVTAIRLCMATGHRKGGSITVANGP
ncbi:MAG TPA: hypothetical protein VMU13_01330 [Candidatus Paceibacterota bacterium]|nr:hypothetical protein [Candidatus Paceibacterota bacterium]